MQMDEYVRSVSDDGGAAAEIDRAKKLLDAGTITQAEYEAIKSKALAQRARGGPGRDDMIMASRATNRQGKDDQGSAPRGCVVGIRWA